MNASVKIIIGVVTASILTGILLAYFMGPFMEKLRTQEPEGYRPEDGVYRDSQAVESLLERNRPVIKAKNGIVFTGQAVNAVDFLESITDADGADIKSQVKIRGDQVEAGSGMFCSGQTGIYFITYFVTDSHGLTAEKRITILVNVETGGSSI